MAPAGFETAAPGSEPPKTHGLDRVVTKIAFLPVTGLNALGVSGTVCLCFLSHFSCILFLRKLR